jgi:Fe-S-cluster containining protein
MKPISEQEGLVRLRKLKGNFREIIKKRYEYRAKSCRTCEHQGICCLDESFVNVHITKLEAVLILEEIKKMPPEKQKFLKQKNSETVAKYGLRNDDSSKTFACPFFQKGLGCLIHDVKPLACIQHACYDKEEFLPPDSLQEEYEERIERLNKQVYRKPAIWLPLPVWIEKISK